MRLPRVGAVVDEHDRSRRQSRLGKTRLGDPPPPGVRTIGIVCLRWHGINLTVLILYVRIFPLKGLRKVC